MRLSALLASLVVALPSVLAAVVPASDNMAVGRALAGSDATIDLVDRSTGISGAPALFARDIGTIPAGDITELLDNNANQPSRDQYVNGIVRQARGKWGNLNWAVVDSSVEYSVTFDGVEGVNWGHFQHAWKGTLGNLHDQFDIYGFESGEMRYPFGVHNFGEGKNDKITFAGNVASSVDKNGWQVVTFS